MEPVKAVLDLMREARSERRHTDASVSRVVKALKALGVHGEDQRSVLTWLEVLDGHGEPYKKDLKPVWDK